jgi:hypothetical protein
MDLTTALATASSTAAAWYNGVSTNTPVVVPSPASVAAAQAAANQVALQQKQQALLAQTNPVLAGILANPTAIVIIGALLLFLLIWVSKK